MFKIIASDHRAASAIFVEFAYIPHDIHVADVVALPRINSALIGHRVHCAVRRFCGHT
jgi:hypothetical protein